jgi:hypothetical protein
VSGQPSPADWKQAWAVLEDVQNTLTEIGAWLPGDGPGGKVRDALERALGPLNVATWQAMRLAATHERAAADGYSRKYLCPRWLRT